ncbi:hypothetical protein U1Q18_005973 [Sarracenia purpurea var. burkii]
MGWILRERGGQEWKRSWTERTLAAIFETPLPLLFIFVVIVFLASTSHYLETKAKMKQTMLNFQLFLILLPVVLIMSVHLVTVIRDPRTAYDSEQRQDGSPWAVAAAVLLLLVLVSYQSSLQSKWFKFL